MRNFLAALSYLSTVRMAVDEVPPGGSAIFFPAIGAIFGLACAGVFAGAIRFLPVPLAALIAFIVWTSLSAVMFKRGAIATLGNAAILLGFAARCLALQRIPPVYFLAVCVVAQAVPRAAMVALAWVSRPAATGTGLAFSSSLKTTGALAAISQGIAISMLLGWRQGLLVIAGSYLILRAARSFFYKRIGGVNSDSLLAIEQALETFILLLFATPRIYDL